MPRGRAPGRPRADDGSVARRPPRSGRRGPPPRRRGRGLDLRQPAAVRPPRRLRRVPASHRRRPGRVLGRRRRRGVRAHRGSDVPHRLPDARRAGVAGRRSGGGTTPRPLPRRGHRRGEVVPRHSATRGRLRPQGLPATGDHHAHGRRSGHGHRDRRAAHGARARRPRSEQPQPPPHRRAASGRGVRPAVTARGA